VQVGVAEGPSKVPAIRYQFLRDRPAVAVAVEALLRVKYLCVDKS